jgi:hypothetical protein
MEQMQCCHQKFFSDQHKWHILMKKVRQKARGLDSNLLEEKCNTTLANVWKYQESLKRYYNKSVVLSVLDIGDLVLKKDIHTKYKHKFSSP